MPGCFALSFPKYFSTQSDPDNQRLELELESVIDCKVSASEKPEQQFDRDSPHPHQSAGAHAGAMGDNSKKEGLIFTVEVSQRYSLCCRLYSDDQCTKSLSNTPH